MRTVGLLAIVVFSGCASTPSKCVGIAHEWSQIDASELPAEMDLGKVLSGQRISTRDQSKIQWFRGPDDSHFACFPGWTDDGCGQETYGIMRVDGEWKAVLFDGIICTD